MSIADSHRTRYHLDKLLAPLRTLLERTREFLPARWLLLFIGIGCLAYSQYLMEKREIPGLPIPIAEEWNILYRLEIINLSNVLAAMPYFLAGLILCAWAGLPSAWNETFINWAAYWPGLRETQWRKHAPRLLLATGLTIHLLFQLGRHHYMPIYPFLWLIVLWLFTQSFWKLDRDQGIHLSLDFRLADLFWLFFLLLIGIGIGAYALQDIPPILVPDEGSFLENARAIALNKYHPAFFDSGVYTFPVASSIFQGWILRLFGVSVWSWRFSSVLAGVAAVIPLYLLGKEWFGCRVAVAAALIMLANPYFLSFARLGYNNSQSLFPVTLAVYFWAVGSRKGSYFYLWLAGLTAGLGFYTYSAVWIGIVTLLLGILYLRVLKQISWRQTFIVFGLILLAWGLAFAPRLAYTAAGNKKEGLVYKILETSFFSAFYGRAYYGEADLTQTRPIIAPDGYPEIFYDPVVYWELLVRGVVRTLLSLFDPYLVTEHFLVSPLAGIITPVFFAIGFILFLRKWKQSRFGLPLLWLVSGLIFLSMIGAFPPRHTHMVSLIPVMALISAAGLSAVVESLTEHLPARILPLRPAALNVLIAVVSLGILYSGAQRYFVTMPETYPPSFEDFVSWAAWRTEKPTLIIYVGRTDIPHQVAYLVNAKVLPHSYLNVGFNEFSPQIHVRPDVPTALFWETLSKEDIQYVQSPPAGFSTVVEVADRDGNILGYGMSNAPEIPLQWKPGFARGWHSLTDTPVRIILLLLLIGTALASIVELRHPSAWPRLSLEVARRTQGDAEPGSKAENGQDFEIVLRFRLPVPPKREKP